MSDSFREDIDQLFQEWLDASRAGKHQDADAFLAKLPNNLRPELKRMIDDFEVLSQSLGEDGPSFESGRIIDDFRLIRELGRGGMGTVWEAEQLSLKSRVALKLLKPQFSFSPSSLARFQREAEAGGRLQHSGIVKTFGVGEAEGVHWIAQELVSGGFTLADALSEQRDQVELPQDWYRKTAERFTQLADALESAHKAGVIHRDIKPGNILITEDGATKIADFGLAQIQDDFALSRTGEFLGTPFYMSPEQAMSKRIDLDHRTDIFSLGATLYETLTLVRAFDGDTSQQVFHKILLEEPQDPRQIRSRVPRDLAVICGKCLEKNAANRYASMAELAEDLQCYLNHEPILAQPPSAIFRAAKWCHRHRVIAVSGLVAAVALVAISALALKIFQEKERTTIALARAQTAEVNAKFETRAKEAALQEEIRERRRAELESYRANINAASSATALGQTGIARQALELCSPEFRGWEWDYLSLAMDQSLRTIHTPNAYVVDVCWSPDSRRFASCGDGDGTISIWNAVSGELESRLTGGKGYEGGLCWSPDGLRLATWRMDGFVQIWDVKGGALQHDFSAHEVGSLTVCWSPDGQQLASCSNMDESVRVWDSGSGLLRFAIPGLQAAGASIGWSSDGRRLAISCSDGVIRILEAGSGLLERALSGHIEHSTAVSFCPDGSKLASGGFDNLIRIWDVETGNVLATLEGHGDAVGSVCWSPDGLRIASGSYDESIRIWDVSTGEIDATLAAHTAAVNSVAWSADGVFLVSASVDRTIRIWDANTQAPSIEVSSDPVWVDGSTISPTSRISWSSSDEQFASTDGADIHIWNARTGILQVTLLGGQSPVGSICWSPNGSEIACGREDGTIQIWDTSSRELVSTFIGSGTKDSIVCVDWSPNGLKLASCRRGDSSIRIWDLQSSSPPAVLTGHENSVNSISWSPDSKELASGSFDATIRIWDVESAKTRATLQGHEGLVFGVHWSPNGQLLASAGGDKTIRIWNPETGVLQSTKFGHIGTVNSVRWSPDSKRLASCGERSIRIWDSTSKQPLLTLTGSELRWVEGVVWSPDGDCIVSSSSNSIQFWEGSLSDARLIWPILRLQKGVQRLFDNCILLAPVLEAIGENPNLSVSQKKQASLIAQSIGNPDSLDLNQEGWNLVRPPLARSGADTARGLRLAQAAVNLEPENAIYLATLAWALLANGRYDEAIVTMENAVELSSDDNSVELEDALDGFLKSVAQAQGETND